LRDWPSREHALASALARELERELGTATRLAVLGVGSELRSDDVAGLLVARRLKARLGRRRDLLFVEGGTAPENFTGEILGFEASHLVVVDCAELALEPGAIRLVPPEEIKGLSSSTHSLPLSIIISYLERHHPCQVLVIGIQPKGLAFDGRPSKEALRAADRVYRALLSSARRVGKPGA
jgi:hydrogenase 3 maturation protease